MTSNQNSANLEEAKNRALLFFMDHLMQKSGNRTIHDLSCQFGARGFTPEMREAVGATQESLAAFLGQYPSLFKVEGDEVAINAYGEIAMGGSHASPMLQDLPAKNRDYEKEAVDFFEQKLKRFGPELQIKSLLGHRSQAAPECRLVSGRHLKDFAEFLQVHTEKFVVEGDRVRLRNMPQPKNPELDLDENGSTLTGARAKQKAVEFLKEVLEAQEEVPLPLESLYQRFCDRFSHAVRQEVATNPKELLQFLKLNRAIFFIRSNKVSLVKNKPGEGGEGSESPPIDEAGYSSCSSKEETTPETITLVKSLKTAQVAIQEIIIGSLLIDGTSVVALDCKFVSFGAQEFLSLVIISTHKGNRYVFDVAHSDSILVESGLKDLLETVDILKVVHDCRRLTDILSQRHGIQLRAVFDTQAAHAIVHNKKYGKPIQEIRPITFSHLQRLYYPESLMLSDMSPRTTNQKEDANWMQRPLTDEMLRIVVEEAKFLVPSIYQTLKNSIPAEMDGIFRRLCEDGVNQTMVAGNQIDKINRQPFMTQEVVRKQRGTPIASRKFVRDSPKTNGIVSDFGTTNGYCSCNCHEKEKKMVERATQTLSTGDITMSKVFYDPA